MSPQVTSRTMWNCTGRHTPCSLPRWKGGELMYSILYIVGAIVVVIVLLRLLGLY